ncbi:Pycsar system effector family protein [Spirillospora sp. CA-142024]|uniref:Pycsar system effector family protein n=1 Tax=Spirillospora sp. CA-142024 TaxID=3240036 RepID=UPI003D92F74B
MHQALHDWTAKVDAKASVILTLETAILSMIIVFAGHGKRLDRLSEWETWGFRGGVALLVAAIALAGSAVFPQLNRRDARRNWAQNYVYFGHLRRWTPAELVGALENGGDHRSKLVLSTQLIALSKIVWRKHAFLQYSMAMVVAGNAAVWASLLFA